MKTKKEYNLSNTIFLIEYTILLVFTGTAGRNRLKTISKHGLKPSQNIYEATFKSLNHIAGKKPSMNDIYGREKCSKT